MNLSGGQVIVVQTEKSNIYHFINHLYVDGQLNGKSEDEEKFIQMLLDKGEPVLKYIVCMWNEYSIDVPTMNFRKILLTASEKNTDAMLVLQSTSSLILKKLSCSMPYCMGVDSKKTRQYYDSIGAEDLCSCEYCKNYYLQIRKEYPLVADYLDVLGVDIEKPHEISPLGVDEDGYIEYIICQYVVFGSEIRTFSEKIGDVEFAIAKSYPSTNIQEKHFVLEMDSIRLKWIL